MRSLERAVIAARDSSPFWAETRIKNFLCEERNVIARLHNDAERLLIYIMLFPSDFRVIIALEEMTNNHLSPSA